MTTIETVTVKIDLDPSDPLDAMIRRIVREEMARRQIAANDGDAVYFAEESDIMSRLRSERQSQQGQR